MKNKQKNIQFITFQRPMMVSYFFLNESITFPFSIKEYNNTEIMNFIIFYQYNSKYLFCSLQNNNIEFISQKQMKFMIIKPTSYNQLEIQCVYFKSIIFQQFGRLESRNSSQIKK
ncbi:unnamed protein product [Paramecium pentaurelia]|uniref:Uncharacterized protein n=1 Tax=Paramecium pentaurelia TaxID=43138 RepID=A0A8S1YPP6_9CILI|nr:unnamed protein product [Paramecium pentaurelia]